MDTCSGRICNIYDGDIRDLLKADAAEQNGSADEIVAKQPKKPQAMIKTMMTARITMKARTPTMKLTMKKIILMTMTIAMRKMEMGWIAIAISER